MAFSLDGKVAMVTGNSTGLGKAIGLSLGKAGAKVPVNFMHNRERAEQTLEEYRVAGIESTLAQADVTAAEGVERLFTQTEQSLGPVDIVVVNATCDQPLKPIEEYDWAFYESMIDFFVKSPFLLTQRALKHMKKNRWGRIVNITSEVFHNSVSPFSAYVAAKGGQIGWSRSMSRELAPFQITVNTVAPGWIPVERHDNDPQEAKDQYLATVPMGRWGRPEEVGDAVLYFASDEAAFVTGQTLCVNGGNSPW